MRQRHTLVAGIFLLIMSSGAMAGWVDYQDVHRDITVAFGDDSAGMHDDQGGFWFATLEQGNAQGMVRSHQISDLSTSGLSFESDTSASGGVFDGARSGQSTLGTMLTLSTDAVVDLHWSYLLTLDGAGFGGAGLRITDMDGSSLIDIDLHFAGEMSATSELELVSGSYMIEMYLDAEVASGSAGGAYTEFAVSMAYASIPAPGTLVLLGALLLPMMHRRRS